jgi:hypothetical protein
MLAMTLAAPRGIDFRADTTPGEAWMRLQDADTPFRPEVVVLIDREREGMLAAFVAVKDLAAGEGSSLSDLPTCYRPVIRSHEALTDAARLLMGHDASHLSVIDQEGRYLGEILRSDVSESLMRMLGFSRSVHGCLLLLQTVETADPLKEIMDSADAAGVRVLGYSELWPDGEADEDSHSKDSLIAADSAGADRFDAAHGDAAQDAAMNRIGTPPTVRTLLLHLDTFSPEAVLSTLRRKGYFPISMSPGLDPSEEEMSDRIDQFLHFLTI